MVADTCQFVIQFLPRWVVDTLEGVEPLYRDNLILKVIQGVIRAVRESTYSLPVSLQLNLSQHLHVTVSRHKLRLLHDTIFPVMLCFQLIQSRTQ